ncbi:hypothetical protein E3O19_06600 [Cryobacterium algoritolerans]|uniref:HdeD family acid-resistance protein n=1 Tax=Cryobacterium algoritolerans TaxID=1259184 RepID=A0A4R8WWI7_9MICO|nr:DUF308 domain-containing protein [Cryobacterium algoritolerans]TFC16800.1 hypothetical protein E3O19_06600 [Cryobacterium algoritolerans]
MSNGIATFDLTIDPGKLSKSELTSVRVAMGLAGLAAVVLGAVVLARPGATLAINAVLFGLYFLFGGVARLARGVIMTGATGGIRVLNIVLGVLLLGVGIVAIRNPLNSFAVLGMIIGISWLVEAVAALVETAPDASKWFSMLFGAISLVAGIAILLSPVNSLAVLVLVGGVFLVISGASQTVMAFTFGRTARA